MDWVISVVYLDIFWDGVQEQNQSLYGAHQM